MIVILDLPRRVLILALLLLAPLLFAQQAPAKQHIGAGFSGDVTAQP